jgi:hypothetical protein
VLQLLADRDAQLSSERERWMASQAELQQQVCCRGREPCCPHHQALVYFSLCVVLQVGTLKQQLMTAQQQAEVR